MAYAIARVAKLKKANIVSSGAHTSRSKEDIPNADPTKKNVRFIGDTNSEKNLEQIVKEKINQHKQKRKTQLTGDTMKKILFNLGSKLPNNG